MILIDGAVDDGYLTLSEGVVKRIVDLQRTDAEACGGIAIDFEIRLQASLLLIGTNVRQNVTVLERIDELGGPFIKVLNVFGLEGVLILSVALPPAGPQILNGGEVKASAGDLRKLWPQARNHLIHR